jgi:hypothetical protein
MTGRAPRGLLVAAGTLAVLVAAGCGPARRGAPDATFRRFSAPTRVDNRWLPLVPGTKYVLEGRVDSERERVSHRVVLVVTDVTKVVGGVRTVVVWDRDFDEEGLAEGELTFAAQDDQGNVWSYGEYPEEWADGKLKGAPSTWIPGVAGARPGILAPAVPLRHGRSYLQGWAPAIAFRDRARVLSARRRVCVPAGCYRNVALIEEWSPDEPAARQLKYHAPGIGVVRVGFTGGGQREELVLKSVSRIGQEERAEAAAQALKLDRRAYRVAARVYGRTARAVGGA